MKGIDKEIEELRKESQKLCLKCRIGVMLGYYNKKDKIDKYLIKKELGDLSRDIQMVSLASIAFVFLSALFSLAVEEDYSIVLNRILSIILIVGSSVIGVYIIICVKRFRFYQLFLELIKDQDDGVIKCNSEIEINI